MIIGGGNSKGQLKWRSFIVYENENQLYLANAGKIKNDTYFSILDLLFGRNKCSIKIFPVTEKEIVLEYSINETLRPDTAVQYSLLLKIFPHETLETAMGFSEKLTEKSIRFPIKDGIVHKNWKIEFENKVYL